MSTKTMTQAVAILTEPLVQTGLYSNSEQALKAIILDYIDHQIVWAEAELKQYEGQYRQTFAEWSASLVGRASVAEEDDWLEWEALLDMLAGWHQVRLEIQQRHV